MCVTEGTVIGQTGNTGNASDLPPRERHLHFEIAKKWPAGKKAEGNKNRYDPLNYINLSPFSQEQTGL